MYYLTFDKLQEFFNYNMPIDEDYLHQGLTERMVLDGKKDILMALSKFANANKQELKEPDMSGMMSNMMSGMMPKGNVEEDSDNE